MVSYRAVFRSLVRGSIIFLIAFLSSCSSSNTYETMSNLYVRNGASKSTPIIGGLKKGDKIVVESTADGWAKIKYQGQTGYVSMNYIKPFSGGVESVTSSLGEGMESVTSTLGEWTDKIQSSSANKSGIPSDTKSVSKSSNTRTNTKASNSNVKKRTSASTSMPVSLSSYLPKCLGFSFAGLALVSFVAFVIWGFMGIPFLSKVIYWVFSFPFFLLNQLQFILYAPERYIGRTYDSVCAKFGRTFIGKFLFFIEHLLLYVVCTPLRFVNACYYNLFIHIPCCYADLVMETIWPAKYSKVGQKIINIIPNFFKLVIFKGLLATVESVIFVLVDTIYPALTLYHGTSGKAGISITKPGTWLSSEKNCKFGKGVYFGTVRGTAMHYADGRSNPVMIVSRVSHGFMLHLTLVGNSMHNNIGSTVNRLGRITSSSLKNGYTSVYSWAQEANDSQKWWEIIMLDSKGAYDNKWRIRPMYIVDLNNMSRKRVPGGMSLWTF